jgi:hypothetical protein
MRSQILTLITVIAAAMFASPLEAAHPHHIGRYLGTGWSDGYHSRAACPPKRGLMHMAPQEAKPLPWWMIPAEDAQPLPKTAPQEELPIPDAATGPSLFRQPGEGSSIYPQPAPSIMR